MTREEIKTTNLVGVSAEFASDDHIPGAVGRTTCFSRLNSALLTIS